MPISSTGSVSFADLQTHFGGSNPITLSEYCLYGNSLGGAGNARGYYGAGDPGGSYTAATDRYDYSSDTMSRISVTKVEQYQLYAGVNSKTRGYWCGGYLNINAIDGLQFDTETAINPSAVLSLARGFAAGVSSSTRGYVGGGVNGDAVSGGTAQSIIDGIQFSTEAALPVITNLVTPRFSLAGIQSTTRGYFAGGTNVGFTGIYSQVDGIRFDTESSIDPSSNLITSARHLSATGDTTRGFFIGGGTVSGSTGEAQEITFSTESIAYISLLPIAKQYHASSSGTYSGAIAGGSDGTTTRYESVDVLSYATRSNTTSFQKIAEPRTNFAAVSYIPERYFPNAKTFFAYGNTSVSVNVIDKYNYETGLCSATSISMKNGTARSNYGTVNSLTRGYWTGAQGDSAEIDGIQFSNETAIDPAATLSSGRGFHCGLSSLTNGYLGGGVRLGSSLNLIEKLAFSTEASSNMSITLVTARYLIGGVNSLSNGYWCGGYETNDVNEIDGIDFPSETALNPGTSLAQVRRFGAGTSSMYNGYIGGGIATGFSPFNTVEKISFLTLSATTITSILQNSRERLGSGYNSNYGIYAGGQNNTTYYNVIDGINFANEFKADSAATLSSARANISGVSSKENTPIEKEFSLGEFRGINGYRGYIAGGTDISQNKLNTIAGIKFSDESTISLSTTLSVYRSYFNGLSSSIKGYFCGGKVVDGGLSANISSSIEGIIFQNEASINPSVTLSVSRSETAGIESSSRGFVAGGYLTKSSSSYEIDGIRFFDESQINPAATLSFSRESLSGVSYGNLRGYFAGGFSESGSVYRDDINIFTFSNETITTTSEILSTAKLYMASVQSYQRGYFAGGSDGNDILLNEIDCIIFSTNTAINSSASLLDGARSSPTGVSSSIKGYFCGGVISGPSRIDYIDSMRFYDEVSVNVSANLPQRKANAAGVQSKNLSI